MPTSEDDVETSPPGTALCPPFKPSLPSSAPGSRCSTRQSHRTAADSVTSQLYDWSSDEEESAASDDWTSRRGRRGGQSSRQTTNTSVSSSARASTRDPSFIESAPLTPVESGDEEDNQSEPRVPATPEQRTPVAVRARAYASPLAGNGAVGSGRHIRRTNSFGVPGPDLAELTRAVTSIQVAADVDADGDDEESDGDYEDREVEAHKHTPTFLSFSERVGRQTLDSGAAFEPEAFGSRHFRRGSVVDVIPEEDQYEHEQPTPTVDYLVNEDVDKVNDTNSDQVDGEVGISDDEDAGHDEDEQQEESTLKLSIVQDIEETSLVNVDADEVISESEPVGDGNITSDDDSKSVQVASHVDDADESQSQVSDEVEEGGEEEQGHDEENNDDTNESPAEAELDEPVVPEEKDEQDGREAGEADSAPEEEAVMPLADVIEDEAQQEEDDEERTEEEDEEATAEEDNDDNEDAEDTGANEPVPGGDEDDVLSHAEEEEEEEEEHIEQGEETEDEQSGEADDAPELAEEVPEEASTEEEATSETDENEDSSAIVNDDDDENIPDANSDEGETNNDDQISELGDDKISVLDDSETESEDEHTQEHVVESDKEEDENEEDEGDVDDVSPESHARSVEDLRAKENRRRAQVYGPTMFRQWDVASDST
jgi:pilus assembly protein FimV